MVPIFLALAPAPILLRFRPPVGTTARYVATVSMDSSGSATPRPVRFTQTVPYTLRVAARKATTTTLETRIGQARVSLPPGSPLAAGKAKMEAAVSGASGTMTVDERGNVRGTVLAAAGGLGKGAQGISFPAQPVRVGESWGATVDVGRAAQGLMTGQVPVTYRLVRLAGGVATVSMDVTGKTDLKAGPQPMTMAMRYRGTFDVDARTGLLRSMRATIDTDATLKAKGTMRQRVVVTTRRV